METIAPGSICLCLAALLSLPFAASVSEPENSFVEKNIRLCLKPQFISEPAALSQATERQCAFACIERGSSCRGFRQPGGVGCQMFVFDSCSHMPSEVSCTSSGRAFVRSMKDLPAGQLFPSGYGFGYHGLTYKFYPASTWTQGSEKCNSEPGLTKYADALDRAEIDYMHWLKSQETVSNGYLIGGYRIGSFATGTWIWEHCNFTFLPEVWMPGQPNLGASFRANVWNGHSSGVNDLTESYPGVELCLCECVDPFD